MLISLPIYPWACHGYEFRKVKTLPDKDLCSISNIILTYFKPLRECELEWGTRYPSALDHTIVIATFGISRVLDKKLDRVLELSNYEKLDSHSPIPNLEKA